MKFNNELELYNYLKENPGLIDKIPNLAFFFTKMNGAQNDSCYKCALKSLLNAKVLWDRDFRNLDL